MEHSSIFPWTTKLKVEEKIIWKEINKVPNANERNSNSVSRVLVSFPFVNNRRILISNDNDNKH